MELRLEPDDVRVLTRQQHPPLALHERVAEGTRPVRDDEDALVCPSLAGEPRALAVPGEGVILLKHVLLVVPPLATRQDEMDEGAGVLGPPVNDLYTPLQ